MNTLPLDGWLAPVVFTILSAVSMLLKDALWTSSTKAISESHTLQAALLNMTGDGLSKATGILTTSLIATRATLALSVGLTLGDMLGALGGVFLGHIIAVGLDRTFAWFHPHPHHTISGVLGSTGLRPKVSPHTHRTHSRVEYVDRGDLLRALRDLQVQGKVNISVKEVSGEKGA